MTDNEIIKALKCCFINEDNKCNGCPCKAEQPYCLDKLGKDALKLIWKQKREIERFENSIVAEMVGNGNDR